MLQPLFNQHTDHYKGNLIAPLELIIYADFQSKHCGDAYTIIRQLQEIYRNKLRVVYRHYPLAAMNPLAWDAAIASEAAALNGKFWKMHNLIYGNQRYLTRASFQWFANELDVELPQGSSSLVRRGFIEKITKDRESGMKSGVEGLPGYFINRKLYTGFTDFRSLCDALTNVLNASNHMAQSAVS